MALIIQNLVLESIPVDQRWGPRLDGQDQGLWEALVLTADPFASVSSRGQIREVSHFALTLNLVLMATHATSPLRALLHHLCEVGFPSNDL